MQVDEREIPAPRYLCWQRAGQPVRTEVKEAEVPKLSDLGRYRTGDVVAARSEPDKGRAVQLPISGGNSPDKLLLMSSSLESRGRAKRDCGMGPVSVLFDRSSASRLVHRPSSGGIVPVSWLVQR